MVKSSTGHSTGMHPVSMWDLVCNRAWIASSAAAVYMAGRMIGNPVFGFLADRFRRRHVMLVAGSLYVLAGAISAASPTVEFFLVTRFLSSFFGTAKCNTNFVIVNEFMGVSHRALAGQIYLSSWTWGYVAVAPVAYFIRDWRPLILVCTLPEIIFYILFYFYIPESPRWLLSHDLKQEAEEVFELIAKRNKATAPQTDQIRKDKDSGLKNFKHLIMTPQLRNITAIVFINWFAGGFTYYGISLNTNELAGNPYVNFMLAGVLEMPAYYLAPLACRYLGRVLSQSVNHILSALMLLLVLAVPSNLGWLTVTLSLLGKLFVAMAFGIMWTYSAEIYPTQIRNLGAHTTGAGARIGATLGAYVGLLGRIWSPLPSIVYSTCSLLAGFTILLLPETRSNAMCQTVQETEEFARNNNAFTSCCRKKIEVHEITVTPLKEMNNCENATL